MKAKENKTMTNNNFKLKEPISQSQKCIYVQSLASM